MIRDQAAPDHIEREIQELKILGFEEVFITWVLDKSTQSIKNQVLDT